MSESTSRAQRSAQGAPASSYYLWQVTGKPVSAGISMDLIDRLEREAVETFRSIESRGSEIGGLLFGNSAPGNPTTVYVEEYEAIPCDYSRGPLYRLSDADTGRFDAAIERRKGSGLLVVGFFRSHTRKGLSLDSDDMTLLEARFREPQQIALLVRPFATRASTAAIFIWEEGKIRTEASYLEFPFQAAQLAPSRVESVAPAPKSMALAPPAAAMKPVTRAKVIPMTSRLDIALPEPPKAAAPAPPEPAQAAATPEPEPKSKPTSSARVAPAAAPPEPVVEAPRVEPAAPSEQPEPVEAIETPRRGKMLWLWGAVAAMVLACSGALFVYPGLLRKQARPLIPLTLRIERTASDLLLTWNRDSDAIRNARRAVLSIYDGDRQENFDMDLAQLRNGSIVYSPLTADVSFKMELTGADQSKIASEMVRVLRTRPSPLGDESAQAAAGKLAAAAPNQPEASAAPVETPAETPQAETASARTAPTRAFNAETLAQRLRPALPAEVPDAPALSASASPVASVNLGVIVPSQIAAAPAPRPAAGAAAPPARQSSQLVPAEVISRKDPIYPPLARQAGASGQVRLSAVIGADGKVKSVKAVSGHPLLQRAAMDAVRQWVYRPTMLNGTAVESQSEVMLTFTAQR
jgi:TonB family protein